MTMQTPESPSNNDTREALIQLRQELLERIDQVDQKIDRAERDLGEKIEKSDYKFDAYQKGTDGMARMSNTIIIATASVVVLSSLSPTITALVVALTAANGQSQILHHSQERDALLQMVRVLAAHRAAKTRSLRKVQDLSSSIR